MRLMTRSALHCMVPGITKSPALYLILYYSKGLRCLSKWRGAQSDDISRPRKGLRALAVAIANTVGQSQLGLRDENWRCMR